MMVRLSRFLERHPVLVPALLLGAVLAAERTAFGIGNSLLPLMVEDLGAAAAYVPFAMGAGGVGGYLAWMVVGAIGGSRRWALLGLATMAAGGALAAFAPGVAVLLAAASLTGMMGFGGSQVLARACEQIADDARRRDLNHSVYAYAGVGMPLLTGLATLLARDGDWRLAMAVGGLAMPCLAFALVVVGVPAERRRPRTPRALGAAMGPALRGVWRQPREPAVVLATWAAVAATMSYMAYAALVALAVVADGIGVEVVAMLTLLGVPTALVGHAWEWLFGRRPRAGLAAGHLPAALGWAVIIAMELIGDDWSVAVRVVLWGVAAVALRLGDHGMALLARGVVLSSGGATPAPGSLSVRIAQQRFPAAVAAMVATFAAPPLFALGHGMVPAGALALLLVGVSFTLLRAALRAVGDGGGDDGRKRAGA